VERLPAAQGDRAAGARRAAAGRRPSESPL
jgi:hypothetical protein